MNEVPYSELPVGVSPQQLKRVLEGDDATMAWVIEAYHGSRRVYWNGHDPNNRSDTPYVNKPDEAIRFARECDAQSVLTHLLGGNGMAVQKSIL